MYERFFGLREAPFSIAPNPRYLYMSEQHKEALAHLLYGVKQDGGFAVLTGEVGTGKTTVCRCFLEQVPENVDVVFILNSKLTRQELLETVCDELGIAYQSKSTSCKPYIDAIFEYLLTAHSQGRKTVLLIDEAQNLTPNVLEQVRLLTNLETNNRKLLQIILIGQPELQQLLTMPQMRQLSQRVTARYHLSHLDAEDVWRYICHRLEVAGVRQPIIPMALVKPIMQYTRGIPRLINVLCDRMLLGAFVQRRPQVTPGIVQKAAEEIFGSSFVSHSAYILPAKTWFKISIAAGLFALSLVVFLFLQRFQEPPQAAISANPPSIAHPVSPTEPEKTQVGTELERYVVNEATSGSQNAPAQPEGGQQPGASSTIANEADGLMGEILSLYGAGKKQPVSQPAGSQATTSSVKPRSNITAIVWPDQFPRQESLQVAIKGLLMLWGRPHWTQPQESFCDVAERVALACFNSKASNLKVLLDWNRPAIVQLEDQLGGHFHAVVESLSENEVKLRFAQQVFSVSPEVLIEQWDGEFYFFWLPPPNYFGAVQPGTIGPVVTSFTRQLGEVMALQTLVPGVNDYTIEVESLVRVFQRSQGLEVDGVVGMQTLMRLNELTKTNLIPVLWTRPKK